MSTHHANGGVMWMNAGPSRRRLVQMPSMIPELMRHFHFLPLIVGTITAMAPVSASAADTHLRTLDANRHFLGALGPREWDFFAGKTPEGRVLAVNFSATANKEAATLFIRQQDVKMAWPVSLNGIKLGHLDLYEGHAVSMFSIPPNALKDGENTLTISSSGLPDDVIIGDIRLDDRPPSAALGGAKITVSVTAAGSDAGMPCRLTMIDEEGALTPVLATPAGETATRSGVVYTAHGHAEISVPAGRYTLHATRGFEYGLATAQVDVAAGESKKLALQLNREVPTPNLVACDTHVHSRTFSGHGDATDLERAITLAGEGIELPIATDHNRYADYVPAALQAGVRDYFTPVLGIEVTTPAGHFNAFPAAAQDAPLPNFKLSNWPEIMASIRAVPGLRVVIQNHPRDTHNNFIPFSRDHFNPVTGDNLRDDGAPFTFDAMELVNSGAMQTDFMQTYRDWFALLNHGYRITGVGSSDCHDVSRFIVGQARSYVVCQDNEPGKIDVDQACRSFKEGRVCVSLGLLTRIKVEERYEPGDLAQISGSEIHVQVRVLGPSWTRADKVELFQNGLKIREAKLDAPSAAAEKGVIDWRLPRPAHDVHLVAIASGPGVAENYWKQAPPYQPSSPVLNLRVIGSTNPVWVDADGDGKFTAPRDHAAALIKLAATDEPRALLGALKEGDAAVTSQAASLLHKKGIDLRSANFTDALNRSPAAVQQGFRDYLATISLER